MKKNFSRLSFLLVTLSFLVLYTLNENKTEPSNAANNSPNSVGITASLSYDFSKTIDNKIRATALCRDNTLSYSQHRRGTCSWHGGVKKWFK